MDIRKLLLAPRAITAFAVTVALTFSCVVEAVSIGEVVLQSRLGEPLLAQIDLMVGSGEQIEDSCLSLAAPDPHEEDTSGYLTKANLSFKNDGKRQYVTISSRKPFNDAFARLRLQVNCLGTASVIKTLTILPDLDASVPQAPITAPSAPAEAANTSARAPSEAHDIAPAANQRASGNAQPDVEKYLAHKAARPANKSRPPSARTVGTKRGRSVFLPAQTASEKQDRSASFKLKLSGDTVDGSRIAKTSAEERTLLLARQKLIDADDQTASLLAMQHQVKQLQDELGAIKLQLAQLGVSPVSAASSASVTTTASASAPSAAPQVSPTTGTTAGTQGSSPKPAIAVKQPVVQQNDLPNRLFSTLGLIAVILALWLGLRYYTKTKSHVVIKSQPDAEPILKPADNLSAALKMAISPVVKPSTQEKIAPAPAVAPPKASAARNKAPLPSPPPDKKIEEEVPYEELMLDEAELYSDLGSALMELGKMDEAEAFLNKAIELAPGDARPLSTALLYIPYQQDDPRFDQLEAVYVRRGTLPLKERVRLDFAMGKAMESVGQYDRSFSAYEEGNRLHYQGHPFDEAEDERVLDNSCNFFAANLFKKYAVFAGTIPPIQDERVPIFIVGMLRSGSTLIEQILDGHPALYGAGELSILGELARKAERLILDSTISEGTLLALRKLGQEYLDRVGKLAPGVRYITDKTPGNYQYLGLIHLMLPNAKIIHSMRDPMDTCFSCYALRFTHGHEYSYDLRTLGRHYLRYRKLMKHWHSVLPPGRILDVRYEDIIADPELGARRMLDYLELPWNPACIRFQENKLTTHASHVTQTRKPIYSSSVDRWKHFEKHLKPLLETIHPAKLPGSIASDD